MKAVIIHGLDEDSTSCWIPWLKSELDKRGIESAAPDMPADGNMESWISTISEISADLDDTILVGHGEGCQAIISHLASISTGKPAICAFLVAPEMQSEMLIDWNAVKLNAGGFTIIYSDDDPHVTEDSANGLGRSISAKMILEPLRGHFGDDDDVTQLPELLKEILAIKK